VGRFRIGKVAKENPIIPDLRRPGNNCDYCWAVYYRWFLATHTIEEFEREYREQQNIRTGRWRKWDRNRKKGKETTIRKRQEDKELQELQKSLVDNQKQLCEEPTVKI
jgi:hypothetical protein